jgi:membrane fusion protein
VARVHVREGDHVAAGAPLLTISMDMTTANGQSVGALLRHAAEAESEAYVRQADAEAQSGARREEELGARRRGLLQERGRLGSELALQEKRLQLAEQTAEAARILASKDLLPAIRLREREEAVIAALQDRGRIERERARIDSDLAELDAQSGRVRAEVAGAAAQAAGSRARIAEKRAALARETEVVLTARVAGRVGALQARAGTPVVPGSTLAVVLPDGEGLEAELWVPSRASGFVRPGDPVRLMYDAFPYQRFGVGRGVVRTVGRAPVAPQDLPVAIETREPLYRVQVRLSRQEIDAYGRKWSLSPGARLRADLVLDERSLLTWLFDPLAAAVKREGR